MSAELTAEQRKRYPRWPWIPVLQLARERGEHPDTFRRWLKSLDAAAGGGILDGLGRGHVAHVNVIALQTSVGASADARDRLLAAIESRVEDAERKITELRAFRRKANAWFKRNGGR